MQGERGQLTSSAGVPPVPSAFRSPHPSGRDRHEHPPAVGEGAGFPVVEAGPDEFLNEGRRLRELSQAEVDPGGEDSAGHAALQEGGHQLPGRFRFADGEQQLGPLHRILRPAQESRSAWMAPFHMCEQFLSPRRGGTGIRRRRKRPRKGSGPGKPAGCVGHGSPSIIDFVSRIMKKGRRRLRPSKPSGNRARPSRAASSSGFRDDYSLSEHLPRFLYSGTPRGDAQDSPHHVDRGGATPSHGVFRNDPAGGVPIVTERTGTPSPFPVPTDRGSSEAARIPWIPAGPTRISPAPPRESPASRGLRPGRHEDAGSARLFRFHSRARTSAFLSSGFRP